MAYEDTYRPVETPQNLILESRRKLSVTAVKDVESFDEGAVVINTARGALIVRGSELHMEKLSLDSGEVVVEGTIDSLEYESSAAPAGGFFSKLFK